MYDGLTLIETKFGAYPFKMSHSNHVFIDFESGITVNRVEYHGNIHLTYTNGVWDVDRNSGLYLTRPWTHGGGDASQSARLNVRHELLAAWLRFIGNNPLVRSEAQALYLREQIDRKVAEIDELRQGIEARQKEIDKMGLELTDLRIAAGPLTNL